MNFSLRRSLTTSVLDLVDRCVHRPRMRRVYARLFGAPSQHSGLTVLDVGAHEGESIRFFREILDEPRVYAFEPQSAICRGTQALYENVPDVHVFHRALGAVRERREIAVNIDTRSTSFTSLNPDSEWLRKKSAHLGTDAQGILVGGEEVEVDTLDHVVEEFAIDRIDLLKIDVEGHELQVLRGGDATLAAGTVGVVQIEVHHDDMYLDYDPAEVVRQLESHGFRVEARLRFPFLCWEEVILRHESFAAGRTGSVSAAPVRQRNS